jgi:hypothetical protein
MENGLLYKDIEIIDLTDSDEVSTLKPELAPSRANRLFPAGVDDPTSHLSPFHEPRGITSAAQTVPIQKHTSLGATGSQERRGARLDTPLYGGRRPRGAQTRHHDESSDDGLRAFEAQQLRPTS